MSEAKGLRANGVLYLNSGLLSGVCDISAMPLQLGLDPTGDSSIAGMNGPEMLFTPDCHLCLYETTKG
jgi:hypothetical protein